MVDLSFQTGIASPIFPPHCGGMLRPRWKGWLSAFRARIRHCIASSFMWLTRYCLFNCVVFDAQFRPFAGLWPSPLKAPTDIILDPPPHITVCSSIRSGLCLLRFESCDEFVTPTDGTSRTCRLLTATPEWSTLNKPIGKHLSWWFVLLRRGYPRAKKYPPNWPPRLSIRLPVCCKCVSEFARSCSPVLLKT